MKKAGYKGRMRTIQVRYDGNNMALGADPIFLGHKIAG